MSKAENAEIEKLIVFKNIMLMHDSRVKINNEDIVIHQYLGDFEIKIKVVRGKIIFSICL